MVFHKKFIKEESLFTETKFVGGTRACAERSARCAKVMVPTTKTAGLY